jgi:catechol 2,3-dioxygenase-like lactoylglutathione lyase family enzyme
MHPLADVQVHHGALSVSNMAASIAFYETVLGFKVDTRIVVMDGQLEIVHLMKDGSCLELFAYRNAAALPVHARDNDTDIPVIGTKHVAFGTDHPKGLHAWLQQHQVAGLTDIFEGPDYRYFYFKDPDGITLEVVSRKGRSSFARREDHDAAPQASGVRLADE